MFENHLSTALRFLPFQQAGPGNTFHYDSARARPIESPLSHHDINFNLRTPVYPEEDVCRRTRSKVSVQFSGDFHGISVPSRSIPIGIWYLDFK